MTTPARPPHRADSPVPTRIGSLTCHWGERTFLMGVLNATPDSFSGDGLLDPQVAAERARSMVAAGADLLDIGAESTRPGHDPLTAAAEWARLGPVLRAVRAAVTVPLTVDTTKHAIAARAFEAGADALNDVHGLRGDPQMAATLAAAGLPAVLMHNQRDRDSAGDVIATVTAGLRESLRVAQDAGIDPALLVLDPGFGFGWEPGQNLELLRRLGELRGLGRALLVGTSRKSTIGLVLDAPVGERQWGTAATVALAIAAGADVVRVHDVAEMAQVARVADAVARGLRPDSPAADAADMPSPA